MSLEARVMNLSNRYAMKVEDVLDSLSKYNEFKLECVNMLKDRKDFNPYHLANVNICVDKMRMANNQYVDLMKKIGS